MSSACESPCQPGGRRSPCRCALPSAAGSPEEAPVVVSPLLDAFIPLIEDALAQPVRLPQASSSAAATVSMIAFWTCKRLSLAAWF